MARQKRTFTQRAFALGETRIDFLEGDDLDLRKQSVRRARNVRVTAARTLEARPGTIWKRNAPNGAGDLIEIRPNADEVFGIIISDGFLQVIDSDAQTVFLLGYSPPWDTAADVWVEPYREKTLFGSEQGIYILTYEDGAFSFGPFEFSDDAGGQKAQPYWAYEKGVTLQPSARTGDITLTASRKIWSSGYVGERIRYGAREVVITEYVSKTVLKGTVASQLPPSFRVYLPAPIPFRAGDTIIGQNTGFEGVVSGVAEEYVDVYTVTFFEGPDVGEKISSPSATTTVEEKEEISPLPSVVWDEPLMSSVRGWPRAGTSAAGRLALTDFPAIPDLVCLSSTREIEDFKVGTSDDDAIVRQIGDNGPRFLHILNAGDLLLFSDRGLYYVSIRDGGLLTPSTFNAILFDKRAASSVRPAPVDDGVVFVEASGQSIAACTLAGDVRLKWTVRTISTYHNHLIRSPTKICGPSQFAETPEKYVFIVNGDGTLAALSYFNDFGADSVGFVLWSTQGDFKSVSPIFGGYWCIIDRVIDGTTDRFIEAFDESAVMDGTVEITGVDVLEVNTGTLDVNGDSLKVQAPIATYLVGETVHLAGGGWYAGTRVVNSDGTISDLDGLPAEIQAGLNFEASVQPWPQEVIESERSGMLKARLIRGSVSVLAAGETKVRANNSTKTFGGYQFGELPASPPPPRTEVYRFSVIGRRDHPEIEIIKTLPGVFNVLAITQELQA